MGALCQNSTSRVNGFVITILCCAITITSSGFCQSAEPDASNKTSHKSEDVTSNHNNSLKIPDLCNDAIDPFRVGVERKKFFRDSGKDNEMTEAQFNASLKKNGGFIRKFDRWAALKSFDKDKNGKINWLEAERCRRELRRVVMDKFDTDHNGHLTGKQRDNANKALAKGEIFAKAISSNEKPAAVVEGEIATSSPTDQNPKTDITESSNQLPTEMKEAISEQARKEMAEMLEKYDANGDDAVNSQEILNYLQAQQQNEVTQMVEKHFDFNSDGKMNEQELSNARVFNELYCSISSNAIPLFMDSDNDGNLTTDEYIAGSVNTESEMRIIRQEIASHWNEGDDDEFNFESHDKAYNNFIARLARKSMDAHRQFDYDGNGVLNEPESQDMSDYLFDSAQLEIDEYDRDSNGYMDFQEKLEYVMHLFIE